MGSTGDSCPTGMLRDRRGGMGACFAKALPAQGKDIPAAHAAGMAWQRLMRCLRIRFSFFSRNEYGQWSSFIFIQPYKGPFSKRMKTNKSLRGQIRGRNVRSEGKARRDASSLQGFHYQYTDFGEEKLVFSVMSRHDEKNICSFACLACPDKGRRDLRRHLSLRHPIEEHGTLRSASQPRIGRPNSEKQRA